MKTATLIFIVQAWIGGEVKVIINHDELYIHDKNWKLQEFYQNCEVSKEKDTISVTSDGEEILEIKGKDIYLCQ